MQNVLSYNAASRNTSPISSSVTDYYQKKLAGGGISDATRAKWAEMDNATGAAAAQMRQDQAQPGMFGQGRTSRAGAQTNQTIMQQVANNKLKQAEMAGDEQGATVQSAGNWQNSQDAADANARQQAFANAMSLGDTVTAAGVNQQGLSNLGYDYTSSGQQQLTDQAAQAKADADWARAQQKEAWNMSKAQNQAALDAARKASQSDMLGNIIGAGTSVAKLFL